VKCTSHKRIVIDRVAEHNQLGSPEAVLIRSQFRALPDNIAH
jgi:hypothetical protein